MSADKPEIGIVLKALNHPLRRDLLIFLSERRSAKFTDLYNHVMDGTKSTGQFSYHLNLLLEARILHKSEDIYTLSTIGQKATSMIKLIDIEVDNSISQKIAASFNQLSPQEKIIISWMILPIVIFSINMSGEIILTLSSFEQLLINLLTTAIFIGASIYAYSRLQYLPSLLALTNIIWIFFLRENHLLFFTIYVAAGIGGALFFSGWMIEGNIIMTIIGATLIIVGIALSTRYLIYENNKIIDIRIPDKEEKV